MKTFKDYIAETDAWISNPAPGDEFDIELAPDSLVESWVVDVVEDGVVLAADERMIGLLESQGLLSERIARYGAVGSSRGMGFTVAEGVMSEIDMDLRQIAQDQDPGKLIDALQGDMGAKTAEYLKNMMQEIEIDLERQGRGFTNDVYRNLDILMDRIVSMYNDTSMQEAEYQGRKVALGKPMQGDVKKFKVYVKDPKTGNVKKVNFGDKTMRIKKSNPARRKSFRARHNCANPGPRTKARYWSCRKW